MDVAELGVAPFAPPDDIAGAEEGGAGMEDGGGNTWICGGIGGRFTVREDERGTVIETGAHQAAYPPKLSHNDQYPVGIDLYKHFCVHAVENASLLSGRDCGGWRRSVGRSRSDRTDGRQAGRACEVEIGTVE